MTIYHFAFSKFKSTISDEQKATAFETAHQLAAHIPGVKYFKAGPPVETTYTQGYGFGLIAQFDDMTSFNAYQKHPEHIKLLRSLSKYTESKTLISYQIDTVKSKL